MPNRIQKSVPFGRILREFTKNGRTHQIHATKGLRTYRKEQPTSNAATKLIERFHGKEPV